MNEKRTLTSRKLRAVLRYAVGGNQVAEKRTLTSRKLRNLLYLSADGKCERCGCDLEPGWHADHVIPWCITKDTNVHDMQALCPDCNRKKGSKIMGVISIKTAGERKHIAQLIEKVLRLCDSSPWRSRQVKIFLDVCPGGGKTRVTPILFNLLKNHIPGLKIGVVVPRTSLASQTAAEALQHGVKLRECAGNGKDSKNPSKGNDGFVVSIQTISADAKIWADEVRKHPYILVMDEAHHLQVDADSGLPDPKRPWAAGFGKVEANALITVRMTGTTGTRPGNRLYGFDYIKKEDGGQFEKLVIDRREIVDGGPWDISIKYSRADGLSKKEKAIVPIQFHNCDGNVSYVNRQGEVIETKISEADEDDCADVIFAALKTNAAKNLCQAGITHWHKMCDGFGKVLVICSDIEHAREVETYIRYENPSLRVKTATSKDDEFGDAAIEEFRTENGPQILVTVGKAYEGLNVPSITHVIILTRIRSQDWLTQAFGRAWRAFPKKKRCHAFVPDDKRMNAIIAELELEQDRATVPISENEGRGGSSGGGEDSFIIPIDGEIDEISCQMLDSDLNAAREEMAGEIGDVVKKYGKVIPQDVLATFVRENVKPSEYEAAAVLQPVDGGMTPRQEEDHLRKLANDNFKKTGVMKRELAAAKSQGRRPDWRLPAAELGRKWKYLVEMTVDELRECVRTDFRGLLK